VRVRSVRQCFLLGDSLFNNGQTWFVQGLFGTAVDQPALLVHPVRHRPNYKYSFDLIITEPYQYHHSYLFSTVSLSLSALWVKWERSTGFAPSYFHGDNQPSTRHNRLGDEQRRLDPLLWVGEIDSTSCSSFVRWPPGSSGWVQRDRGSSTWLLADSSSGRSTTMKELYMMALTIDRYPDIYLNFHKINDFLRTTSEFGIFESMFVMTEFSLNHDIFRSMLVRSEFSLICFISYLTNSKFISHTILRLIS
jgi:hypothetical protein